MILLILTFSASVLGQVNATSAPVTNATLDIVNVGEASPAGRITGFGPPEPQTHPGSWGGAPAGSAFYRVLWFEGDEPFGIVKLKIPPHTVASKLEITYLNGLSGCAGFGSPEGDTFAVYAANRLDSPDWAFIGTVVWDSSACTTSDQERAAVLYLRYLRSGEDGGLGLGGGSKGKNIFVRLVSTAGTANQPWAGFIPFGQVAIHTVKLIGKVTNQGQ
jgi:hypothetical protein